MSLKFQNIYRNCNQAVRETLTSWWCGETVGESQEAYASALRHLIESAFSPDYAMPIVQCMNLYRAVDAAKEKYADDNYISGLWNALMEHRRRAGKSTYHPYEHQYDSWKALNEKVNGETKSIVVTTGTGSGKTECFMFPLVSDLARNPKSGIQALFLYPLNALMEDQKSRLNATLEDIKNITGVDLKFAVYNGNLPEQVDDLNVKAIDDERKKYSHIVATREEMRSNPPAIILTNPTMLEYMMLRDSDQLMISQSQDLRWIVIDETHTYTGAAATELAMLMRRVIDTFQADTANIRFATSSATLGNGADAQAEEEQLRKFISDISGQTLQRIEVITGERDQTGMALSTPEAKRCQQLLFQHEYLPLDKAVPEGKTIEEKLTRLDSYCDEGLKVKVHFFNQVLNTGIKARLQNIDKGHFEMHVVLPKDDDVKSPCLDLYRCSNCGEYLAVGELKTPSQFQKVSGADTDIFDREGRHGKIIFGLEKDKAPQPGDENVPVKVDGDRFNTTSFVPGQWNIMANMKSHCPHCGQSFTRKDQEEGALAGKKIRPLRISADFASRIISYPLLSQAVEAEKKQGQPFQGRKYLSFVDSRQSAAQSTLKQNLECERRWVYSTIYNELNRMAANGQNPRMEWEQIADLLTRSADANWFCLQFSKRTGTDEIDANGRPTEETMHKYIHAVMIELLGRHPAYAASPENMGLFTSYFPALDSLLPFDQRDSGDEVAQAIEDLNNRIADTQNKISFDDWKDLLKIVLDWNIRSNESVFLCTSRYGSRINIKNGYQRFQAEKIHTRPYQEPSYKGMNLIVKALNQFGVYDEAIIQKFIAAIKTELLSCELLEKESPRNPDTDIRLNLAKMGFRLFDSVWLCNAARSDSRGVRLRPADTLFKGFSPWLVNNQLQKPFTVKESWAAYPYIDGRKVGQAVSIEDIHQWAASHRSILWNNGLWGKDGLFSTRLDLLHSCPPTYIQAEHTAQIDKHVAKKVQEEFLDGKVNILACSTTMEMGIDLGDLEIVLLNSIPNNPASYKQRAGRSGRDPKMRRSVCVTLCGTDSIGLRTLRDPMKVLIDRVVAVPYVDMENANVIQRHVNAYLLKRSGTLRLGSGTSALRQDVINFFTPYYFDKMDDTRNGVLNTSRPIDENERRVHPDPDGLGNPDDTPYKAFLDYLEGYTDYGAISQLVVRTALERVRVEQIIQNALESIKRCYVELTERVNDIAADYRISSDARYRNYRKLLDHKYCELLARNLLMYLANSRFTPNANMPVNIVELDVCFNEAFGSFKKGDSNPSYPIQEALTQYLPGNTVVLGNRAIIVRGVLFKGFYSKSATFQKLYTDGQQVSVDTPLPNPRHWAVTEKNEVELIRPYAFTPDTNEMPTRTLEANTFSKVEALLIDTTPWATKPGHLVSVRTNKETGNSKILYYTAGVGYGYCVCKNCGHTVLEVIPPNSSRAPRAIPANMNPLGREAGETPYHTHPQKGSRCCSETQQRGRSTSLRRNVILGDYILTDFAEIKIRHTPTGDWVGFDQGENLLTTLGILIARATVEYLGVEPRDVSFMVTRHGSICIYDTNQGGSGYSNNLGNPEFLDNVLDRVHGMLANCSSKEELLDRFTLRYVDDLDIDGALDWVKDEITMRAAVPDEVKAIYPTAKKSRISNMIDQATNSTQEITLLVKPNWEAWNYRGEDNEAGFRERVAPIRISGRQVKVVINGTTLSDIPVPAHMTINEMADWADVRVLSDHHDTGLYPLMMVGNRLYFTNDADTATLNGKWGTSDIFVVDLSSAPQMVLTPIPREMPGNTMKATWPGHIDTTSRQIPAQVESMFQSLVNDFKSVVDSLPRDAELHFKVMDEHIKSVFAMVLNLQFVEHFAKKFNRRFSVEFVVEKYDNSYGAKTFLANLTGVDRTNRLRSLLEEWKSSQPLCASVTVDERQHHDLPHWREITITATRRDGSKAALSFYPNGGVHNEWSFDKQKHRQIYENNRFGGLPREYKYDTPNVASHDLPILKDQEVMYDAVISK
ncbi:MAG: DEAD/DEAH box helicase [Bacteroidales bacterium]|nr:DEAD/DEAH box helicase [Bacteroidales bacterium]